MIGYTDSKLDYLGYSVLKISACHHTEADNRRFRLNLVIETQIPFEEFDWAGKHVCIGDVELEVLGPVGRCAAINVDPDTMEASQQHLRTMQQIYGHTDFGMFARIVKKGTLVQGAHLRLKR